MADQKQYEKVFVEIDKAYGEGSIMWLGQASHLAVKAIPTGSLALDWATGVGGVPRGRITEAYGLESSGKSTLCQHIIAEAQRQDLACAYIDVEHALDPEYAVRCGVNLSRVTISQPTTGEEALNIARKLVRSGLFGVIIVDSVAALVPKAEFEGNIGDNHMGLQARMMGSMLRMINPDVQASEAALIFTNQIRMKIGVMFGNPETTTGGNALKFYASMRLELRKKQIKEDGQATGHLVTANVTKNKVAAPFRKAEFEINFGAGIDKAADVLDLAAKFGAVTKRGAFYSYGETRIGQGRENAKTYLKEHPEMLAEIEAKTRIALETGEILSIRKEEETPEVEPVTEDMF